MASKKKRCPSGWILFSMQFRKQRMQEEGINNKQFGAGSKFMTEAGQVWRGWKQTDPEKITGWNQKAKEECEAKRAEAEEEEE